MFKMPQTIIDSHIHLWPASAANPAAHGWMEVGALLTKQYSIQDYNEILASATSPSTFTVAGFVYVETDRAIGPGEDVDSWAAEPLREISFLRRIVEGKPEPGEGFSLEDGHLLRGIIAWAPLDRGVAAFRQYLHAAEKQAGDATWARVRGFRFLLQGIKDQEKFRDLVVDQEVVETLREIAALSWSFDVGVDQRQGDVWQLDLVADLIERVQTGLAGESKAIFILSKYTASMSERYISWNYCSLSQSAF
jgi:L-rhamnono-1,4-lactonase